MAFSFLVLPVWRGRPRPRKARRDNERPQRRTRVSAPHACLRGARSEPNSPLELFDVLQQRHAKKV